MGSFKIENLRFCYPNRKTKALDGINLTVNAGEFVTLCGKSGCGKTTLLRLLKPSLTPAGNVSGNIYFKDLLLPETDKRVCASEIGFVMQNPDSQIVTDKVWHELAFGLENLGLSTQEIRTRVAEMASFFGIHTWFDKSVSELSGGQKQMLNLASVMVMQPSVLILDEPTSQQDPIAAQEFMGMVGRVNRELGTTVIVAEHRLEEAFPMSDKVVVMDRGRIIADGQPKKTAALLKELNHEMLKALPTPMRVWNGVESKTECPVTVREGRLWLEEYSENNTMHPENIPTSVTETSPETVIEIKDAWFRYEKNLPDVIKGLNLKVKKGEILAITGGNGTGKTTAISLISAINKPYRGEVFICGKNVVKEKNPCGKIIGMLPQNPKMLFVKKTVYLDLQDMLSEEKITEDEKREKIKKVASLCRLDGLLESHPFDLSGGEQQRAALAKILLKSPEILLLDEPTKGMDAHFKGVFASVLEGLKQNGITVVIVSHDIEFCAECADRCALFFDGNITSEGAPREFFAGNSFYTTAACRMAKTVLPQAVFAEDIILACGGTPEEKTRICLPEVVLPEETSPPEKNKLSVKRIVTGCFFAFLFLLTEIAVALGVEFPNLPQLEYQNLKLIHLIAVMFVAVAFYCFFPQKEIGVKMVYGLSENKKLTKRTVFAAVMILIAIPVTVCLELFLFKSKNYFLISLIILIETSLPFAMIFENRKPRARELVIISVICGIAVAGRAAFFMLPNFKPVVAIVIIAGVCFGGETGFLVGAITGFMSNFFFLQGPWTPWQMFSLGIIGFLAGILYGKRILRRTKTSLCIFGGAATLVLYGMIMNLASVIIMTGNPTWEMMVAAWLAGMPMDIIHAGATLFFLWFISDAFVGKIERIKLKYGLIDNID